MRLTIVLLSVFVEYIIILRFIDLLFYVQPIFKCVIYELFT